MSAKCLLEFVWNSINTPCYTISHFSTFPAPFRHSLFLLVKLPPEFPLQNAHTLGRISHFPDSSISIAFAFFSDCQRLSFPCLFLFSRFGLLNIYCVCWASATICCWASRKDFSPVFWGRFVLRLRLLILNPSPPLRQQLGTLFFDPNPENPMCPKWAATAERDFSIISTYKKP